MQSLTSVVQVMHPARPNALRVLGDITQSIGKERSLVCIINSVVWKGALDVVHRMAGRSGGGAGCFCRRSSSVSSLIGAVVSSEQRMRDAALIFLSSNFAASTVASAPLPFESWNLRPPGRAVSARETASTKVGHPSWKTAMRFFISDVRLRRRPPLKATSKIPFPKAQRRCHPARPMG